MFKSFTSLITKPSPLFRRTPKYFFTEGAPKVAKKFTFVPCAEDFDFEAELRLRMKAQQALQQDTSKPQPKSTQTSPLEQEITQNSSDFLKYKHLIMGTEGVTPQILSELLYISYLYINNPTNFSRLFQILPSEPILSKPIKQFPKENLKTLFLEKASYFAEHFDTITVEELVTIIKCIDATNLYNNCSHLLFTLQKGLKKENITKDLHEREFLYLLKASTFILKNAHKYNQMILLFILDNMNEKKNYFTNCNLKQIKDALECYEQILSNSIRTNVQKYLAKSLDNLQKEITKRLKVASKSQVYDENSLANPRVVFSILKVFRSMGNNVKELYDLCELTLIKAFDNYKIYPLKSFMIAFKILSTVNCGGKLLDAFWVKFEKGHIDINDLRNYDKLHMLEFLQSLLRLEVTDVYSQLKFKQHEEFTYFDSKHLHQIIENSQSLKKNIGIYSLILNDILDTEVFEQILQGEDLPLKTRVFQTLFWLDKTGRSSGTLCERDKEIMKELLANFETNGSILRSHTENQTN